MDYSYTMETNLEERRTMSKLNARVETVISPDGLPSIVVHTQETPDQIQARVRQEEFHWWIHQLKANNDNGSMTPAMWLMYELAYYERGFSGVSNYKAYLKRMDRENDD